MVKRGGDEKVPRKMQGTVRCSEANRRANSQTRIGSAKECEFLGIIITVARFCAEHTVYEISKALAQLKDLQSVRMVGSSLRLRRLRHIFSTAYLRIRNTSQKRHKRGLEENRRSESIENTRFLIRRQESDKKTSDRYHEDPHCKKILKSIADKLIYRLNNLISSGVVLSSRKERWWATCELKYFIEI